MDDVNWNLILPGEPFPTAVEEMFEDGKLMFLPDDAPVYRAISPDVAGELYAVGRFGDESPVVFVYCLATYGRLGPDSLGRIEYVTTLLDLAPEYRADYLDAGLFLDWAYRETVRRIARDGAAPRTSTPGGGDPKCD